MALVVISLYLARVRGMRPQIPRSFYDLKKEHALLTTFSSAPPFNALQLNHNKAGATRWSWESLRWSSRAAEGVLTLNQHLPHQLPPRLQHPKTSPSVRPLISPGHLLRLRHVTSFS